MSKTATIKKIKTKIGFQAHLSLNTGQKYCRMLQGEHSAILTTFIKLQFAIKIFILSIFKWSLIYCTWAHAEEDKISREWPEKG